MQFLRNQLDAIEEKVKDNKYLHTTFDAIHTFLYKPNHVSKASGGVHIHDGMDLKRTMFMVVVAMQLALLFGMWNIGHQHYAAYGVNAGLGDAMFTKFLYGMFQMLPLIVVANLVGLGIEFIFAAKRGHAVEEGFLVSGMLIPLIMPPAVPLWMVALATAFAVIIGKEAFGGTGMNPLNIALLARVFVFFAYPTEISGDIVWVDYAPNFINNILGLGVPAGAALADTFSGATPLALAAKGGWSNVLTQYSVSEMFWGTIPGSIGETCKPAIILGALMLIGMGIASWRIMLSMIIGAAVMGFLLNIGGEFISVSMLKLPEANPFFAVPWYYHYIMGSFFFAMAFMATDPVTAAQTNTGKWIYGFMIGVCGIIVRVMNPAYPEGWMLAILFCNVFAPLIDNYVIQSNIKRRLARGH